MVGTEGSAIQSCFCNFRKLRSSGFRRRWELLTQAAARQRGDPLGRAREASCRHSLLPEEFLPTRFISNLGREDAIWHIGFEGNTPTVYIAGGSSGGSGQREKPRYKFGERWFPPCQITSLPVGYPSVRSGCLCLGNTFLIKLSLSLLLFPLNVLLLTCCFVEKFLSGSA